MSKALLSIVALGAFLFAPNASSGQQTLNFSTTNNGTQIGSSGITYSSMMITGGTATGGSFSNTSGSLNSTNVGGIYDGNFFDPVTVDGSNAQSVAIGFNNRDDIDAGIADDYANFLGFHVSFSAPVPINAFGVVDLDGTTHFDSTEWAGSFAFDSTTGTTTAPSVGLSNLAPLTSAVRTVDWTGLANAPTSAEIAFSTLSANVGFNADPDAANSQVSFDYGGVTATDLYFVWGVRDEVSYSDPDTSGGVGNAGVTGFTVDIPNADAITSVPEPSAAILLLVGGITVAFRRRRSSK